MEEVEPRRHLPTPTLPSESAVARHRENHLPYQSWCDQCVEGRGQEFGHKAANFGAREITTVAFDYLFVNDKGMFTREELDASGVVTTKGVKILVVKYCQSKCTFGHVVPTKGIDEKRFAVDMISEDVAWLGYTRLILKSDNEPAIEKLANEALRELRIDAIDQVMKENPPPFDSQ